jgi:hypothetical protein
MKPIYLKNAINSVSTDRLLNHGYEDNKKDQFGKYQCYDIIFLIIKNLKMFDPEFLFCSNFRIFISSEVTLFVISNIWVEFNNQIY